MNRMIKFVAINGPLGVGKSWVAANLEKELAVTSRTRILRVSFQDCLRKGVMTLLDVADWDYDIFKKTEFYGKTGRQWMIDASENFMKSQDPYIFSKILHDRMAILRDQVPHGSRALFVADSWGFESEGDYFRAQSDVVMLTCCIEPPNMSERRGLPWIEGDSRFNLAHKSTIIAPDSTAMLKQLKAALDRRGWI